jgi:hypothetical protein
MTASATSERRLDAHPHDVGRRVETLTIGAREGSYPGMLATRTFRVVLVTPESPSPFGDAAPRAR